MISVPVRASDDNVAERDKRRQNFKQQAIVERGIAIQQRSGSLPAVEYLKANSVKSEVIARVLIAPEKRRASRA